MQSFTCDTADGFQGCVGLEDASTMIIVNYDSGDVFREHLANGAQPFIVEDYGSSDGLEYYAVVATLANGGICGADNTIGDSLAALSGVNVCSSGYRRSSGWTFPVSYLISNNIIPVGRWFLVAQEAKYCGAVYN